MSFTDDFFSELDKKKKKKKTGSSSTRSTNASGGKSYSEKFMDALGDDISPLPSPTLASIHKYGEDDIAPAKGGNKDSIFKSGGFSDGVDGVGDFFVDLGQTVLGTAADVSWGVAKGAGRMVEGLVDLGAYGVAEVADKLGAGGFAEKAKKVARYNATDEWTKDVHGFVDQYSILGNKADAVSEGLGQVGAIILTGAAGAAAGLGAGGVAALTTGATGLSSMGTNMGDAFESGATDDEAFWYGLSTGAIEAGTELLFGGLGKGVKALGISRGIGGLDEIFAKKLSSKIAGSLANESVQKALGNTVEYAVKAGGEGVEEVLSGLGSAVMKKLTYADDKTLRELIEDENLLEQFVVGTVVSGIAQGGDFVKATKSGTDFVTGHTAADEKVIDKVVEEEVAKREAAGEKLSTKDKNKIYDSVVDQMEKGQIDIDTIESVLGGDTYKAYKETVDSEDALKNELAELRKMKAGDMNDLQTSRMNELKGMNLDDTTKRDGLRKNLDDVLSPMLKDSKLSESYRERERRGQAFEADLSKYTGKQRAAVERAVKSGVLNNTYRSHELVDVLSKIEADKGIAFDYTNNAKLKESGFAVEGKTVNGFADKSKGAVTLNVQSAKAWQSVVGHEITHVLEGTDAYSELRNALYAYAESKGELEGRRASLTALYQNMDADIDAELTADLVGDYLFTDKAFINNLTGNRTLFQKIYDEIKYLWNVATGKEKNEIDKVKAEFDRVWKEYSNNNDEISEADDSGEADIDYSISVTDKATLDFLDKQKDSGDVTTVYRAMQAQPVDENGNVIKAAVLRVVSYSPLMVEAKTFGKNGKVDIYPAKLFSPMAGMVNGKWSNSIELNKWEQTTFDLANATTVTDKKTGKPKIDNDKKNASYGEIAYYYGLVKGGIDDDGKKLTDVPARYNPYIHTSLSALNDQFSSASKRPELVTVECIIPNSELTSGFRAEGAKDRVGAMNWHSGPTSSRLAQVGKARTVILTRYDMPVRVLPDSEVAKAVAEYIGDTENIAIQESTVTPSLSRELMNLGISVLNDEQWKQYSKDFPAKTFGSKKKVQYSLSDSEGNRLSKEQQEYFKDSKVRDENGSLLPVYHGSKSSGFNIFEYSPNRQTGSDYGEAYYFTSDYEKAFGYSYDVTKDARIQKYHEERKKHLDRFLETKSEADKQAFKNVKVDGKSLFELMNDESYSTGGEVKKVYLNLTNPHIVDAGGEYYYKVYDQYFSEARENGNDGIIVKNVIDNPRGEHRPIDVYIAFEKNQIKNTDNINPSVDTDIRYSLSPEADADYMSAVERGDTETAQKMVDEAAKKAGYDYHLYHGTDADFTKFDLKKFGGRNGKGEGYGIYLAANREISAPYGKNVINSYTKFNRLAEGRRITLTKAEVKRIIQKSCDIEAKRMVDDGEYDSFSEAVKDTWVSNYVYTYDYPNMSQVYTEVADVIFGGNDNDGDIINEIMSASGGHYNYDGALDFYDNVLTPTTGIDGFHYIWGNTDGSGVQNDIYLAFNSEQIKSADPITYDDNGNVIPLSERFNAENEDIRYSLSKEGEEHVPVGNYSTPFKELALEGDIAPVSTNTPTAKANTQTAKANTQTAKANTPTVQNGDLFPDGYTPVTEEEADALSRARYETITDADAPPEMDAPYYESEESDPADPFENRDIKAVGSQKVKAYMYENPEVKPFFQKEADILLGELQHAVKGERIYAAGDFGGYGAESYYRFMGTKRHASPDIEYLLDECHYSYEQIEKGIKAILEDNGAENNAASKRIEFVLNDRLRDGYQDWGTGIEIPPDEGYLNLLREKEITEYNEEAFKRLAETADDSIIPPVVEDIAPITETATEAPFPDEVAPMTEEEANAIQDEKAKADAAVEGLPKSRKQLHSNIIKDVKATFSSGGFDLDDVLSKAKDLSTFSTVDNTPQRVMEKALGYKEGQVLADLTVNKVAQNETKGIKWLNSFTDRKNGLLAKISNQYSIKPGSKESAAAQMYAEGFYVNDNNDIVAYGDAELAKDFPDVSVQNRIKGLAGDPRIRQIYDETLEAINKSRARNAYPEIQRLENYFLHFRAMDDTFSKLGIPFNPNDIRAKDLPTDLNGVTADLKPGQPYFASSMHRKGKRTSFDLLGGLERYLTAAKNQIYHIDDIQTLRALRNYIADTYGQAKGLEVIDLLSEEEAQDRIEKVYDAHLSTFAKFLNEEANVLAGKTALIDRGLEGIIGRRGMTFLDTVNRQVGSNMVGFNISSSLTNFLPVAQTFAKTNKFDFLKAFTQTVSNKFGSVFGNSDSFTENSPVIIRRKGADRFYRTPFQKAGDAGYALMSAVDDISTELIARTKFNELTRNGMDEQTAHFETDKWVSRLMGDRSLGQQPQLYNSKMLGVLTKFQLEVRNQLDSQFYDTIQEAKVSNEHIENALARNAKTAAKVTATFVELAVVQHLFGKAFESVAGYNPAFDIISTLATMFGWDDDEEIEDTVLDNIEQGFLALLEDLPYTSTLTGGRIPIANALPVTELIKGVDSYGNEKSRWETLGEAAPYYILPGGYGQIKKTAAGLNMFSDDHPVTGSYTDSGKLRFPVEDTPLNRVQAAIFGQYASKNAREYFDNGYAPLSEKQTQEFIDVDMPIKEYREYREGLKKQETLEDKFDYISGLDLPVAKKNILINNVVDRKEAVDLEGYEDFGSLEEFDFATKNPEKYAFAKSVGGYSAYKTYSKDLGDFHADKDENGKKIKDSRKEKVLNYINNLDADFYTKVILYKSEYPGDDTYNRDIVNYINEREDLSYEDRVAILTELGFRVTADGQIYAD